MCGVVGFWNKGGKEAEEDILKRMVKRLTHRGPDDNGIYKRDSLGLGHTRLSILDLSQNGHQPFVTKDGMGVLSFNGEIYNFRELRHQLKEEGVTFKSSSDTEVLLYALYLWGPEKAVPKLDGMFAFAYFDLRDETLWLVRDRSGIKPLYWVEKGNLNIFASEMKALFDHPDFDCRPDMHALTTQVIYRRLDGDWTPFEGVKSVLPGQIIKITRTNTEEITYFDLERDVDIERILNCEKLPFEDLLNSFEKIFQHSVESHLVSDAPLATMCSGGLDSSLIAAVAREQKADLVGYVADVDGVGIREAEKAQKVCDHIGMPLNKIKIDQEAYLRFWPKTAYHNDQPNFFPQNILWMLVCNAAHKDGFKVLLAGEGADELFGGYDWQVEAYNMWRLRRLHSRFIPNNRFFKKLGSFFNRLSPIDFAPLMEQPFHHMTKLSFNHATLGQLSSIDGLQRRMRAGNLFNKLEKVTPLEHRAFLARGFDDFHGHLRTLLRTNDKMGMSVSIEPRVPFLSNQLIDFGLHLNLQSKYNQKKTKYIVKQLGEKKLPHDIVHAKKIGFGYNDEMWSNTVGFLRGGLVPDLFKWGASEAEKIFDDLEANSGILHTLVSIELWAQIYLNHESTDALSDKLLRNVA